MLARASGRFAMSIAASYAELREQVPSGITIVAVSKYQSAQAVREAIRAGAGDIAENYVQEARAKFRDLEAQGAARVRKHFIGRVQTNKAKAIASLFDLVQSVDRPEAGTALAQAAASLGKRLPVLVQVNISSQERYGCSAMDAPALAQRLRAYDSLRVDGIMAIGPIAQDRSAIAQAFDLAADVWRVVGGPVLSIGMSDDWREAARAGSTMIRVGTALFGPRPRRPASKNP